jgi:hypothetical protein
VVVPPGATVTIADIEGPAVLKELRAKVYSDEKWSTRKVMLRGYWDGENTPSINCPIGDFFGGPKDANYRSYPMVIADDINSCYFPMPFRRSAQIDIVNEGRLPIRLKYSYGYLENEIPDNWGYFKAKWRGELSSTTFDYPLIKATGTGKLVGICLFPDNLHGGWWGEGDEKVYVDGEKFPSWFGTGSEDYFGDAWGIRHFANPCYGHPQEKVERMQGCYRWHLGDNIPFYQSLKMTIENYTGYADIANRNDYSSVAYWYQLPGGSDFFTDTPVEDRIPTLYVAPNAVEVERHIDTTAKGVSIVENNDVPKPLSRGRGVELVGKAGSTFTLRIPAKTDERYRFKIHTARDLPASEYEVLQDGKVVGDKLRLKKGLNDVQVRLTGKPVEGDTCRLVIDYITPEVYRNLISNWMMIGPFDNPPGKGFDTVYPPERELNLTSLYTGREGKKVGWQKISRKDGIFILDDMIRPKEFCILYAACTVDAPTARKDTLLIGSDDGIKVWLNGKIVWKNLVQRRMVPDSDKVEVELQKGENLLLIKLEQRIGNVGFAIRFLDPLDELTFGLPD